MQASGKTRPLGQHLQNGSKCSATAHQHREKMKMGYSNQPSKQARGCSGWEQDKASERDLEGRVNRVEEKKT